MTAAAPTIICAICGEDRELTPRATAYACPHCDTVCVRSNCAKCRAAKMYVGTGPSSER